MIKAHQGIHENFATNRQPAATASPPRNSPLCDFATLRLCVKNPVIKSRSSPNQGKNPSNRASSSLIKAAMKILPPTDNQPQPPALPGIPPFATLRLCAFALKTQSSSHNQASIKAKKPAIVPDQGSSRQTAKMNCRVAFKIGILCAIKTGKLEPSESLGSPNINGRWIYRIGTDTGQN